MSEFKIQGGLKLQGEVTISGSKNATLPILAATLLTNEKTTLKNVPNISDVHSFLKLMEQLGVKTNFEKHDLGGTVTIDPSNLQNKPLEGTLVREMRASITFPRPLARPFWRSSA